MTQEKFARVIVFKDGDHFVAQCLEYDICAYAKDEESVKRRFVSIFGFERNLSIERNGSPFAGIDPAPKKFHDLWANCEAAGEFEAPGGHLSLARCAA
jgi:hypothetical protein